MKAPACRKCGSAKLRVVGKRNALYPVALFQVFGFLLTCVHQLQSPVDFECEACGARTGVRSGLAMLGFWLLILLILGWLSRLLPFFLEVARILLSV